MQTAEFDYHLPEELIAQQPAARREGARLLVVDRATRRIEHRRFFELPTFLRAGDQLIRNTARVRPARLFAQRDGGGRVECLLLRAAGAATSENAHGADAPVQGNTTHRADARLSHLFAQARKGWRGEARRRAGLEAGTKQSAERWWCLLRPGRRLPVGARFGVEGEFSARVLEKSPTAEYLVEFAPARAGESVAALAERLGRVPLPPYIHRENESGRRDAPDHRVADLADAADRTRYQTVFADRAHTVAVAAPTAGLHFSEALLTQIAGRGIEFLDIVLHVGLGTFRPIETDEVAAHPIHRELIEIPAATQARLAGAGGASVGRRIAVGTTSVRAVEHWARVVAGESNRSAVGTQPSRKATAGRQPASTIGGDGSPAFSPEPEPAGEARRASAADFVAEADLFIRPPATFRVVEGLITNFHLPRSTLLCLVAAFLTPGSTDGVAWLRDIYAEAIRERYRFLSYGDAMLIL